MKNILIIGAGSAGKMVAEELLSRKEEVNLVGFLDDKVEQSFLDINVLGKIKDLPDILKKSNITEIIICIPSKSEVVQKKVAKHLSKVNTNDIIIKNFPTHIAKFIDEVISGELEKFNLDTFLHKNFQDKKECISDINKNLYKDKVVLVTGGAGSIGSEVVKQLCILGVKQVISFDSSEYGTYNLDKKLNHYKNFTKVLGNVRDKDRVLEIVDKYNPTLVIHAAAYKHVPILEQNESEAYKTNVIGTRNILEVVQGRECDFILVSTDKAVEPSSVMGKTKQLAENIVYEKSLQKSNSNKKYLTVRFGNVIGSSGSVIPNFIEQLENQQDLTVTDFRMKRFFITIPEAVSLVLKSWEIGRNGGKYVLDMGKEYRILDIAKKLIKSFGLSINKDIKILETGIREGEKLNEILASENEEMKLVYPKIFEIVNFSKQDE